MSGPIEVIDSFIISKERTVYTSREHQIPSLHTFGYHSSSRAKAPLQEHFHKNCFEFTYIVQGNLSFYVDHQAYSLSGGDLFLTFPNEVHSTGDLPMSLHQEYWFQLESTHPEHFLNLDEAQARWLLQQLRQLHTRRIKMDASAELLLRDIFSNIAARSQLSRMQACCQLGSLLIQILKRAQAPQIQMTQDIGAVRDYIHAHIQENISMEELASAALLSVPRLKQKFKDQVGTSPRNYINYHKIELAKKLLQAGKSVTDTAMALSFSGSDYFSVVFRRYTLLSPTAYKHLHSGKNST